MKKNFVILLSILYNIIFITNLTFTEIKIYESDKFYIEGFYGQHMFSLSEYKEAKRYSCNELLNLLESNLSSFYYYYYGYLPTYTRNLDITSPSGYYYYGAKFGYILPSNKNLILIGRIQTGSVSGEDNIYWRSSAGDYIRVTNSYKFTISDIAGGIGYRTTIFSSKSLETFDFILGNYSVELKGEATEIDYILGQYIVSSLARSHSGSKIYFELGYNLRIAINSNIMLSFYGAYKLIKFDKLGTFKDINDNYVNFNFSGLSLSVGLTYRFH